MNKICGAVVVILVVLGCVAGFFYVNPQHVPAMFRYSPTGFEVPAPSSPVSNFRSPQF